MLKIGIKNMKFKVNDYKKILIIYNYNKNKNNDIIN